MSVNIFGHNKLPANIGYTPILAEMTGNSKTVKWGPLQRGQFLHVPGDTLKEIDIGILVSSARRELPVLNELLDRRKMTGYIYGTREVPWEGRFRGVSWQVLWLAGG